MHYTGLEAALTLARFLVRVEKRLICSLFVHILEICRPRTKRIVLTDREPENEYGYTVNALC